MAVEDVSLLIDLMLGSFGGCFFGNRETSESAYFGRSSIYLGLGVVGWDGDGKVSGRIENVLD